MQEKPHLISGEGVVALLLAVVGGAAGMLVETPFLSSVFLTATTFSVAVFVVRRRDWFVSVRAFLVVLLLVIASLVTYTVYLQKLEKDLRLKYGTLVAGNQKTFLKCLASSREFDVVLGTLTESTTVSPFIVFKVADDDLIIENDGERVRIKKLRLKNAEGKVVVRIDDNDFDVSDGFYFLHPDGTLKTLAIRDDDDREVFYLNFLNTTTLIVRGEFRSKSTGKIIISQDAVNMYSGTSPRMNLMRIKGGCLTGTLSTNADGGLAIGGPSITGAKIEINPPH